MKHLSKSWAFLKKYKLFGLALISFIIGLILYFSGEPKIAKYLISAIALIEVIPLAWGMLKSLRDGTYGIDILAATAIIASVAVNQYWAAIIIVIMLTGGEALEDYAEGRAETELNALLTYLARW
jgi:cation transport ATPase